MTKSIRTQKGQATTEMVFMLLGFAVLLLGIVFTLSLEIFNTRVLMDSKYRTERSINFENAGLHGGAGKEIWGWDYEDDIPFTLKDTAHYRSTGEVTEAWTQLENNVLSNGENYNYRWMSLRDFPQGKFKSVRKENTQNTIAAANLITRQGEPEGRNLTAKLPELYTAFAKLLHLRINLDKLRDNPSNRVFLPANGEL